MKPEKKKSAEKFYAKFGNKIMSHIGKKGILMSDKVELSKNGSVITMKGPLGELKRDFGGDVEISVEGKNATVKLKNGAKNKALWGTYTSHLSNMAKGVTTGFEKKLIIEGVGFKAQAEGANLSLIVGLSHPVKLAIPAGVKVVIEKSNITVTGPDKEVLGQFCADIREVKKPEPYKGTGIRYSDEVVRRKAGKKAAAAAA